MKIGMLIGILALLVYPSLALADSWETFGKNLTANGINRDAVGYLNRSIAFFNISFGMDVQPLVYDLDGDGFTELVLWQNDTIRIYNKSIQLMYEYRLGVLKSQPSVSNFTGTKQIVAIQGNNFTVLGVNSSGISIVRNFNLSYNISTLGIVCGLIDNDSLEDCVFKDVNGFLHMFDRNAASQVDDRLNVNVSNNSDTDIDITIPSIADFDNDSRNEIMVRHSSFVTVVDSVTRTIDFMFDMSKDSNYIGKGFGLFPVDPVFIDADKDGYYEIIASYPKSFIALGNPDRGMGYRMINSSGAVFWSSGCAFDAATSSPTLSFGSKPVPLDTSDGPNTEIVLGCYGTESVDFKHGFTIGINVIDSLNATEFRSTNASVSAFSNKRDFTAIADINNNGILDIVLANGIYEIPLRNNELNLTFDYLGLSFEFKNPIVVDIDGNGALDIVQSSNHSTYVFLDNTSTYNDLSVISSDISYFRVSNTSINVSVMVHNLGSLNAFSINVTVANQNTGDESSKIVNITSSIATLTFTIASPADGNTLIAQVDTTNVFNETDESNNFAETIFKGTSIYLDIRLPYSLNTTFEDYLKDRFSSYNFVSNVDNSDIVISVGKRSDTLLKYNDFIFNTLGFGIFGGIVTYNGELQNEPYIGLVAGFENDSRKYTFVLGNEIEGEIAAARALNEEILDNMIPTYLDDSYEDGIATFEYLHNNVNNQYYATDTENFRNIVKTALNGRYSVENFTVYTNDNVSLRLMKVKTLNSKAYQNLTNRTLPVVLSKGLWSNINDWKDFAQELADDGSEAWVIEITGGPGTECDTCVDYTFDNLTDSYWPALIGAVQFYTNSSKVNYVGFSNGCRAALSSLDKWNNVGRDNIGKVYIDNNWIDVSMSAYPVDTFVGVACPGAFNKSDPYGEGVVYSSVESDTLNTFGSRVISNARQKNLTHTTISQLRKLLFNLALNSFDIRSKISINLFQDYYNFSSGDKDNQPANNLNIPNFIIIEGDRYGTNDLIVFISDEKFIYNSVNSSYKKYFRLFESHHSITEDSGTRNIIIRSLLNQSFTTYQRIINLKEES
ncbi:hypothetical protein HYV81_01945 [Candidatus Woesearchaeota archaeon]|nr:hypothetical protein [Candidatus Woesearchaeota archaeon]